MRPWTRKSASIHPRTSLGKSDVSWPIRLAARGTIEERDGKVHFGGVAGDVVGETPACVAARRGHTATLRVRGAGPLWCWPWPRPRPALFRRLVLGWIDADFRVQIRILQHFSKSTRKSPSREQVLQNSAKKLKILKKILTFSSNFAKFWKFFQKSAKLL